MTIYTVQVKGHLDPRWEGLFEGFRITHRLTADHQPVTILTGAVLDQAALYGLFARLRDLGADLISVQPLAADPDEFSV